MLFYLKLLVQAPFYAVAALCIALPYIGITAAAWVYLPGSTIPQEYDDMLRQLFDHLPRKRTAGVERSYVENPWGIVVYLLLIWITVLCLFRLHRSVLRVIGHGDTGNWAMILLPPRGWFLIMLLPVVGIGVFAVGLMQVPTWMGRFDTPITTTSPIDFVKQYWNQLRFVYIALMLVFVPFGLMLVQRASCAPLPFSTFGMAGSRMIFLGLLFLIVAVPTSILVLEGIAIVLQNDDGSKPTFPLQTYLLVQGSLAWLMLIVASVRLLERRIDQAIARGDVTM